jgi:hypothetical protein
MKKEPLKQTFKNCVLKKMGRGYINRLNAICWVFHYVNDGKDVDGAIPKP